MYTAPIASGTTAFVATIIALYYFPRKSLALTRKHVPFWLKYPPTFFAAIPALAILLGLDYILYPVTGLQTASRFPISTWIVSGVLVASLVLATGLCSSICERITNLPGGVLPRENFGREQRLNDVDAVFQWLASESPIHMSGDDYLDRSAIARRLACRFIRNRPAASAVGLIGQFGIGKSSVVHLMKQQVEAANRGSRNKIWISETSCWGFDNAAALLEHILDAAIQELSMRLDCLSIRGLPAAYRRAISAAGPLATLAADVLDSTTNPGTQLRRLTPLLKAADARLVIVVEDLDRNESPAFDIQQAVALLHRLKSVPHVALLLSGQPSLERARIDFVKLCEHMESLTSLSHETLWRVVQAVRLKLLKRHHFLDAAGEPHRGIIEILHPYVFDLPSAPLAIAELVQTPRLLKHILRHCEEIWSTLHGEIDFDDMLVANVLRYGAPEAFAFLLENASTLRSDLDEASRSGQNQQMSSRQNELKAKWESVTSDVSWNKVAVLDLIAFLFPNTDYFLGIRAPLDRLAPQGMRHSHPIDYWERFLGETLAPGAIEDQRVLLSIRDFQNGESTRNELPARILTEPAFAMQWEHLSVHMSRSQLFSVATEVISLSLTSNGADSTGENEGILAVRQRLRQYARGTAAYEAWLTARILEALPVSLALCNDLFFYWASVDGEFVDEEGMIRLRSVIVDAARAAFNTSAGLLNALGTIREYDLYHLIFPAHKGEVPELPCCTSSDWSWLGPILVNAAVEAPEKLVPQIIPLITEHPRKVIQDSETGTVRRTKVCEINEQVIVDLFSGHERRLMEVLSRPVAPRGEVNADTIEVVNVYAKEWLAHMDAEDLKLTSHTPPSSDRESAGRGG